MGTYSYLGAAPWKSSALSPSSTLDPTDISTFSTKWGLYNPFSADEMQKYRAAAETQGNLYVVTDGSDPDVAPPSSANAIIYVDFQGTPGTYNFKHDGFATERPGGVCQNGKSLVVVVANGNINVQGNTDINAVVIVDGNYLNTGNAYVYGGIFARGSLDLGSDGGLKVDPCAVNNAPPGGTSSPSPRFSHYEEHDGS